VELHLHCVLRPIDAMLKSPQRQYKRELRGSVAQRYRARVMLGTAVPRVMLGTVVPRHLALPHAKARGDELTSGARSAPTRQWVTRSVLTGQRSSHICITGSTSPCSATRRHYSGVAASISNYFRARTTKLRRFLHHPPSPTTTTTSPTTSTEACGGHLSRESSLFAV
jgi:hypothetical protein